MFLLETLHGSRAAACGDREILAEDDFATSPTAAGVVAWCSWSRYQRGVVEDPIWTLFSDRCFESLDFLEIRGQMNPGIVLGRCQLERPVRQPICLTEGGKRSGHALLRSAGDP
jgi:hypothetical protein